MKKIAQLLLLVLCATMLAVSFAACTSSEAEPEAPAIQAQEPQPEPEVEPELAYEPEEPVYEPEQEPETTPEATPVATTSPDTLSDDLYSFMFSLNGDIFTLPFAFTNLADKGWTGQNLDVDTLRPNQFSISGPIENNGQVFNVSFINTTQNVLTFEESNIGRIFFNERDAQSGTEIIIPGGITIGSSMEEIIAAHGEPSDRRENSFEYVLEYSLGTYTTITLRVNRESGQVAEIQLSNFIAREAAPEFEGNVPAAILAYQAPTSLGDDWQSFIVRLDGDLYQLPAPISSFIANGWAFVDDPNEMVAAQSTNVRATIRRGNQVMRIHIHNYDDAEQPIAHTFVTRIEFSHHFAVLPIELPGGITENSTLDEILAAFGEPRRTEEGSMFNVYEFGSGMWEQISISIRNETETIHSIAVINSPRSLN